MEPNEPKRKKRRIKRSATFAHKLSRSIKRQIGKNEDGKYQWEIVFGIVLVVVLIITSILYVYWNINRG